MSSYKGNRTLSGTHGEVWVDGEKIWELSKIEQKITANREDVQLGIDVDSKLTGLKGEFTLEISKVYTRFRNILEDMKNGVDHRVQIIANLKDPDAIGAQMECYSTDNCWFNDLPFISWEKGAIVKDSFTGGFTPSDMVNLDKIA